ncbi:MAG: hypothetical protein IJ318_00645 [Clostridia bacterium]|nr:hypothetical protein [Clostridia bacterium]
MNVFENALGNWIEIIDDKNDITIENYGYETGVIGGTTENHCVKCVAVNKCWFKNEKNKKPERFDKTNINLVDLLLKGLMPGLYHPNCHCKENPIYPTIENIKLLVPKGKIDYLFNNKGDWIKAFGYHENDKEKFLEVLLTKTRESYFYGNYYIQSLTNYGCKINLQIDIPGINEKSGKVYKIETNYMIFPKGKIKMNTPIGGWQK